MQYVKGEILTQDGFQKGYLSFERNKIIEMGKGLTPEKPLAEGIIVPKFINAHTHLGDSFIRDKKIDIPRNVEEVVAPPDGLKHRLLKNASENEIINGIITSINKMIKTGTMLFCDFREGGIEGIELLKNALKNKKIESLIFSRPSQLKYEKNEIHFLLENSTGIGLSSISDWEYTEIEKISKDVKIKGKKFAFHASEACREDIDLILDLHPDFLIHMVSATESDLIRVKDEDIPIVICPRSNKFFNLKINFKLMKKIGIDIMLGTDNAMLSTPNVLEEIIYLSKYSSYFSNQDILNMATYTPRKVLNLNDYIHGPNLLDRFVVLDKNSLKPVYISD